MSANKKKTSGRQSNLFSFFQKTPKREINNEGDGEQGVNEVAKDEREKTGTSKTNTSIQTEVTPLSGNKAKSINISRNASASIHPAVVLDDSDDEPPVGFLSCASSSSAPPMKRRRVILSSDEEHEEENKRPNQETETPTRKRNLEKRQKGTQEDVMEIDEEKAISAIEEAKKKKPSKNACGKSKHVTEFTHSFIDTFGFDIVHETSSKKDSTGDNKKLEKAEKKIQPPMEDHFPHLDYEFLKPDKIKDAKGRRPSDPEYDARTLLVPEKFLKEQSPGHQQWWKLKCSHFDTILFFKVGKFYELYHMDAVIAVENLGLTYMRGKFAHCGFPEIGYGRFADQLVNRGYKVARIEQTETPNKLAERQKDKKGEQKEKVVRREICRISTKATKTYGILDGTDARELDGSDPNPSYLMALTEKAEQPGIPVRYGVCFVDCSVGKFTLSEFDDDPNLSNLRTLLAHNFPTQLLYEKNALSPNTVTLLKTMLASVPREGLHSKRQFRNADNTLTLLCGDNYFGADLSNWPNAMRQTLEDDEATIAQPSPQKQLCLSALGAIIWYLQECLIDVDLLSMRNFEHYLPPSINARINIDKQFWRNKHMVLDGTSLLNLHILPALSNYANVKSGVDKSLAAFSLYNTVNRCATAFGKRLLRVWISAPSCDQEILLGRQQAIKWLIGEEMGTNRIKWAELLRKMPDFERLFQRIHTIGLKHRSVTNAVDGHPDSRAQMFEVDKYNKRKIRDLLIMLDGLEAVQRLMNSFVNANETAIDKAPPLIAACLGGNHLEMIRDLKFFKEAFDREKALEQGIILPRKDVDKQYDDACSAMENCKKELDDYLERVKRRLKCTNIKFVGTGRNSYQLEVPEANCRNISDEFHLSSQRKGFKRYTTSEQQKLISKLAEAETHCDEIGAEVTRKIFSEFDSRKNKWATIVNKVATFDCLLSLALYAKESPQRMCFPEFLIDNEEPLLVIEQGFHPSLINYKSVGSNGTFNYIPNDCQLGGNGSPRTVLLTGPNMGGKTTYMRQVAGLVILAQIGSMVPANSMKLTPVDRIFCRIGAGDRLIYGQSTFYVELAETNTILRQTTKASLVLIDELGRGTSSFDGSAIACASLRYIAENVRCRTLFSTHYHSIIPFLAKNPNIAFAHMACMSENASIDDPTMESITFLYTLTQGVCDKSYGFYTAKMAGIDVEIVRRAFKASQMHEVLGKTGDQATLGSLRKAAKEGVNDEELYKMIKKLKPT